MEKSIRVKFAEYVSLNILGMVGISCYILADTFFISIALGATGIAALNLSISIYSIIHGAGLMVGLGGAARYSILMAREKIRQAQCVFTTSLKIGIIFGIIFVVIGIFGSAYLAKILGADEVTLPLTKTYLTTILCFAPFFILNNILLSFVRNDNNPNLSMIAMLTGSFSNIILDYIFMFPLKMGMFGAAFATGLAPMISLAVLMIHFIRKNATLRMVHTKLSRSIMSDIITLGMSSFITEVSSAAVLITFNIIILGFEGNVGIAAYGIIANLALVGIAVFTGLAQGIQPLISKYYGLRNHEITRMLRRYALVTSIIIAGIIYLGIYFNTYDIIELFNSEKNQEIVRIAVKGLRIYFLGFFFVGINIVTVMVFSASENAQEAFILSIARGFVIIIPLVLILSRMWQMTGVWIAFVLAELIVACMALSGRRNAVSNKDAGFTVE